MMRRGKLAADVLRGADIVSVQKRRRWPLAMLGLGLGAAIGAIATWISQAGKPVQLTASASSLENSDATVDLTQPEHMHQ